MADSLEVALPDFSGETAADPSPAAIMSAEALLDIIYRQREREQKGGRL